MKMNMQPDSKRRLRPSAAIFVCFAGSIRFVSTFQTTPIFWTVGRSSAIGTAGGSPWGLTRVAFAEDATADDPSPLNEFVVDHDEIAHDESSSSLFKEDDSTILSIVETDGHEDEGFTDDTPVSSADQKVPDHHESTDGTLARHETDGIDKIDHSKENLLAQEKDQVNALDDKPSLSSISDAQEDSGVVHGRTMHDGGATLAEAEPDSKGSTEEIHLSSGNADDSITPERHEGHEQQHDHESSLLASTNSDNKDFLEENRENHDEIEAHNPDGEDVNQREDVHVDDKDDLSLSSSETMASNGDEQDRISEPLPPDKVQISDTSTDHLSSMEKSSTLTEDSPPTLFDHSDPMSTSLSEQHDVGFLDQYPDSLESWMQFQARGPNVAWEPPAETNDWAHATTISVSWWHDMADTLALSSAAVAESSSMTQDMATSHLSMLPILSLMQDMF